jgi:hypothetical protein
MLYYTGSLVLYCKFSILLEHKYFTGIFVFFTGQKILSETWKKFINWTKLVFYRTFKLSPYKKT